MVDLAYSYSVEDRVFLEDHLVHSHLVDQAHLVGQGEELTYLLELLVQQALHFQVWLQVMR